MRAGRRALTVHFIGAGPGAADLLTLRGRDLLGACPVCLHAGSTVSGELLRFCREGARVVDTAPLSLDEIVAVCVEADAAGQDVARLHSGDLAIHSAVGEQLARLRALGIGVTMTPGVSALGAAACAIGRELTVPGVAQSVVVTRLSGRATAVPESLEALAATGAVLVLHLSVNRLGEIGARLAPVLGADCPAVVVERASWPEQRVWWGTLGTLAGAGEVARMGSVLVGHALRAEARESALYSRDYARRFRPR